MRKKEPYRVITFHTTTAAMGMEKFCKEQSIPGRLIPVPREISAGCGLSWRMKPEEYDEYQEQIMNSDLAIQDSVELMI